MAKRGPGKARGKKPARTTQGGRRASTRTTTTARHTEAARATRPVPEIPDAIERSRAALAAAHAEAPAAGIVRTISALAARPHAWLSANRLAWWHDVPTNTGPIANVTALGGIEAFDREFASSFALVTGGATDALASNDVAAQRVPWSGARAFLERVPDSARFAVAVESLPLLDKARPSWEVLTLRPRVAGGGGSTRVLAIDFAMPQRAVGLECGYGSAAATALDAGSFVLRAYRRDGSLITMSDGQALLGVDWRANEARRIGVRDRRAEIASVELHAQDPGLGGNDFLFVLRVWSETLPPAAVTQGALFSGTADAMRAHMPTRHPDFGPHLGGQAAFGAGDTTSIGAHPGTLEVELPFGCTEAAVFLRGHKWILGGAARAPIDPTKLKEIHAGVTCVVTGTGATRRARLTLAGGAVFGEDGERSDADVIAFFSLVAWHPERTHVVASPITGIATHPSPANLYFEAPNNAAIATPARPADTSASALFAAPHAMRWTFPRPVEPQRLGGGHGAFDGTLDDAPVVPAGNYQRPLMLVQPISGGSPTLVDIESVHALVGGIGTLRPVGLPIPPLGYSEDVARIRWFSAVDVSDTIDADERMTTLCLGTALNGAGLDIAQFVLKGTLTIRNVPPRSEPSEAYHPSPLTYRLATDVAVPALGAWYAEPEDEVAALDIEIRGESYDGEFLVTRFGGGAPIDAPGTDDPACVPYFALPYAAGLRARHPTPRPSLAVRPVAFDWYDNTLALQPRVFGTIRNDGNVAVQLGGFALAGANAAEFQVEVAIGPVVRSLVDLQAMPSLVLRPGEQITVGGRFFSSAAARAGATRVARLTAQTSRPASPSVAVDLVATGKAGNARGAVAPTRVTFGNVRTTDRFSSTPALPGLRSLLIESTGTTPLTIRSLAISFGTQARPHPDAPRIHIFSAPTNPSGVVGGALLQLDPGTSLGIQLSWLPYSTGTLICQLVAETNIGRLVADVTGTAVRP